MPRRARTALWGAAGCVALLIATWYAFHLNIGERLDRSVLLGFAGLHRPRVNSVAKFVDSLCDPGPFILLAAVVVIVALHRRRPRVAVMCALVLFFAPATAELLKHLVPDSHLPISRWAVVDWRSWPSGHVTSAMSLALCAAIVAPPRRRPRVAAVMGAFAVAVCYSVLELAWHFPSDVLGGLLLATAWTLVGLGALWWLAEVRPARRPAPDTDGTAVSVPSALAPAGLIGILGLLLLGVITVDRPHAVIGYVGAHAAFAAGAVFIAAVGLAIAAGVTIALRR